ncbi:MAG: hypothetical protein GXO35_04695 [Gammaproteobacteria bacterium]|nr:hypothetical protein [Gammaproteobacteria bacterium]
MDIKANRGQSGEYQLEIGPVVFELPAEALGALQKVIDQRLNKKVGADDEALQRKLAAYRTLASKMAAVDDRIMQKFSAQVSPEQLVTIVRLSGGRELYDKVLRNLSKQNARQFEEDYLALDKISEQHACLHMEQAVHHIKRAAQEQKELQA